AVRAGLPGARGIAEPLGRLGEPVQAGDGQEAVRVGQPGLVPAVPGTPGGGELAEACGPRGRQLLLDRHGLSSPSAGPQDPGLPASGAARRPSLTGRLVATAAPDCR